MPTASLGELVGHITNLQILGSWLALINRLLVRLKTGNARPCVENSTLQQSHRLNRLHPLLNAHALNQEFQRISLRFTWIRYYVLRKPGIGRLMYCIVVL